jgi:hypothetical protein
MLRFIVIIIFVVTCIIPFGSAIEPMLTEQEFQNLTLLLKSLAQQRAMVHNVTVSNKKMFIISERRVSVFSLHDCSELGQFELSQVYNDVLAIITYGERFIIVNREGLLEMIDWTTGKRLVKIQLNTAWLINAILEPPRTLYLHDLLGTIYAFIIDTSKLFANPQLSSTVIDRLTGAEIKKERLYTKYDARNNTIIGNPIQHEALTIHQEKSLFEITYRGLEVAVVAKPTGVFVIEFLGGNFFIVEEGQVLTLANSQLMMFVGHNRLRAFYVQQLNEFFRRHIKTCTDLFT